MTRLLPPGTPFRSLALLFVFIAIVPMIAVATFLVSRVVKEERAASERLLLQAARLQIDAVEQEMNASVRALGVLAEADALTAGDLHDFHNDARRVLETQPSWLEILLFDASGAPLVNTDRPWGTDLPAAVEPESVLEVARSRHPVVGVLKRGPSGRLAYPIRVPVIRGGALRYVLTAVARPERLADILAHDFQPHEEWTRGLVDPAGTIAARTLHPEQFVGTAVNADFYRASTDAAEGVRKGVSREGETVYSAFSRGPTWGWRASVAVPTSVLDGTIRRSRLWLAGVSSLAIGLSVLLALVVASGLSGNLRKATTAAAMLARGEAPGTIPTHVAEIAELDAALQQSARLLAERRRERDEHLARANDARAAAEQAARAKDEFLAMLGHELRNPLSPIVTALHLLRMKGQDGAREYAVIDRQVRHLTRLVDDLLDVSRIARGKIELKRIPVELKTVVDQALEMTAPLFEEREQTLSVDVPADGLSVWGDPPRLAQVVSNLLVNASKYTPPRGAVAIDAVRDGADVVLHVRDNGRGVSPDLLPHVFDLFVQGPRSVDRQEGGLGLGLTLVKQLVQLHGGSVAAESAGPEHGSTFSVRLPASVTPAAEPSPPVSTTPPRRASRVLIVDDNIDALDTLAALIRSWGHEVLAVSDAAAAIERAPAFAPEVALLDIGLPVMNGYELSAALRARISPPPLFVAVTGYGQTSDFARSTAEGFAGHLVKPVDADQLQACIMLSASVARPASAGS